MNKENKIFKNVINVNNNKTTFYSKNDDGKRIEVKKETINNSNLNVNDKLNNIFKNKKFMYTNEVNIKLNDRNLNTRLVSLNNNKILTIDNEVIDIKDIIDIN